jgi:hypothetical protein
MLQKCDIPENNGVSGWLYRDRVQTSHKRIKEVKNKKYSMHGRFEIAISQGLCSVLHHV